MILEMSLVLQNTATELCAQRLKNGFMSMKGWRSKQKLFEILLRIFIGRRFQQELFFVVVVSF